MSLEIQDEFASKYAKYSGKKDLWLIGPHQIGHIFTDWLDKWIEENESTKMAKELNAPNRPSEIVKSAFNKFISSLKKRNHVHIPKEIQAAAFKEYLED